MKIALAILCLCATLHAANYNTQWGQWRGPLGNGFTPNADPPLEWSETKNVRWKTPLPGLGHSSPVVWGDHVYLTTAVPHTGQFNGIMNSFESLGRSLSTGPSM